MVNLQVGVAPLEVDILDLNEADITRIVQLQCRQCGASFDFAQLRGEGLPWYCATCAVGSKQRRARQKEARKMARRRADPRCRHKRELDAEVRAVGHAPLTGYRVVTCTRCWQLLARRRGPAKSTLWFVEPVANMSCTRGRDEG